MIFVVFALLCGSELLDNVRNSAQRDIESVRYVRSLGSEDKAPEKTPEFNLDKILEETDVDG